ncbi:LysR family transcriptional regulator [Bordetella tumulicola]|uniref:LysR family transcriptional regulator n=1 Tax=Bordetella tumulicola TaxID=1649133 RepID=UPI0039EF981A
MFELRLVRQFVVVAEELNFRRAAERLHMSQPPLSTAVRNLETDIGTTLLDRSKHHVRLTPAGQVFYKDAVRLLRFIEQARERARRTNCGLEGTLRLSFVPSAALDVLPEIFKRFQHNYPTVHLTLTAETTRRQLEDLQNGHTDLALLVGPVYDSRGLELVELRPQRFVLAVPSGHPLAKREKVKMKELAAESFVSFPAAEGMGFVNALLRACQTAGFMPRVVQEASQMQAILTLVAGGLGIALVPSAMRRLHMEDVCFLDISDTKNPPTYQLVFAYASGNDNPVIPAFLANALGSAHPLHDRNERTKSVRKMPETV